MHPSWTGQYNEKMAHYPHLFVKTTDNCKAAFKWTRFVHCTSSQHVEVNELSAFEDAVERCWVLLSQIWNWPNFSLNTAQYFLCFAVTHVWLNKVECICTTALNTLSPRWAQCPAYPKILSHDSTWAFVKSSECTTCWVIVEVQIKPVIKLSLSAWRQVSETWLQKFPPLN